MKPNKTLYIVIIVLCLCMSAISFFNSRKIPYQAGDIVNDPKALTLMVICIKNDHEVIFSAGNGDRYVMSVENAFDDCFRVGTVIFFGKGEVKF